MSSTKIPAMQTMPDFTGRIVNNGQYQLTQLLGSGAYGVVYRAVDMSSPSTSSSTSQLAIKVLRKASMSKRTKMHVRREIALHRLMSGHPNVVGMHHAFEDGDYVYITLDYCPGGDLFGKICEEKIYYRNDDLVKKVFLQLLEAVHACHRKRIFHRDLKPENILVNEDGSEVYISDFGLATTNQVSETFGCGSSYYMSPECIGKECGFLAYSNRANDIWALGVVLINMITCRSPWQKAVTMDDCFSDFLLEENYLREMLPISKGANKIFRKIFNYDPIERISIPALRKEILALDTFFMEDDEIARSGRAVKIAHNYCIDEAKAKPTPKAKVKAAVVVKVDVAASPHVLHERPAKFEDTPTPSPITTAQAFIIGSLSSADSEDSDASVSSSGSESNGPVTPATSAQDLDIEVAELNIKLDDYEEGVKVERIMDEKEPLPLRIFKGPRELIWTA
ncbi:hypothetical protein NM688_g7410 [Phlebia brevispora]|uniref:Uncharacterized protein n=1 Tax=Phlebia brevispora TaxID=194682 RepID=A0ACC1S5Q1_9APHY|nr:hypothetical protein NM688_g7410 [Phlebia brevispora]